MSDSLFISGFPPFTGLIRRIGEAFVRGNWHRLENVDTISHDQNGRKLCFEEHGLVISGSERHEGCVWDIWLVNPDAPKVPRYDNTSMWLYKNSLHVFLGHSGACWRDGPHWAYIETVLLPWWERELDNLDTIDADKREAERVANINKTNNAINAWAKARGPIAAALPVKAVEEDVSVAWRTARR